MSTYNMIAAGYTQVTGYANAAALNAAASDIHYNGYKVAVADAGVFYLNKESTATPDNTTIIAALDGGNWLIWLSPYVLVNSTNMIDASQYGSVASLGSGSAGAPSLAFAASTTTGIYRVGADDLGIATNGVLRFDISTTAVTSTLPIVHAAGAAATPSITFTGDTDTGIYHSAANTVAVTANGALVLSIAPTAVTVATGAQVVLPASTAAAPALTLGAEQTGPYLVGAGSYGISVAGVIKLNLTASALNMASGVALQIATVQVVGARNTGWVTMAGAGNKSLGSVNASTITATDGNIQALAAGVKSVIDALISHGLIGA